MTKSCFLIFILFLFNFVRMAGDSIGARGGQRLQNLSDLGLQMILSCLMGCWKQS